MSDEASTNPNVAAGGRAAPTETLSFQAEVARLLHMMVHSVYTEREIAIRELISNASDACDKLRYEAISHPELTGVDSRFAIRIEADKVAGTLAIVDNGIGMDRAEMVDNLGTIARSGTRAFLDRITTEAAAPAGAASSDAPTSGATLIGQFGVGFYSAFMLAREVEVVSVKAGGSEAWTWRSAGTGNFTIAPATEPERGSLARGTRVRLHLADDARHLLESHEIERLVARYSDHIQFPVELSGGESDGEAGGENSAAPRQINRASAVWQRPRGSLTKEETKEAYHALTGLWDEPAHVIHYKAEGRQSFAAMLFIPTTQPFDLLDPDRKGRQRLYVRRVYITDDADLLPAWLRFVRGVVDSEDVPLNISREMLQNNPVVGQIRKALTQRVVSELKTFAGKDAERWAAFQDSFGPVLKEGLYEDFERQEALLEVVRFRSTSGDGWRSLADYVQAMRPNQTEIYYLTGESRERLAASPQLEEARARGVEVLLLADTIDSFWTRRVQGFAGKPLRSLALGDVELSLIPRLEGAPETAPASPRIEELVEALRAALGAAVADVRASKRLVESPSCLVAEKGGNDRTLERLLARQDKTALSKPVLEINPAHTLVTGGVARMQSGRADVADLATVLLGLAHVLDGEAPPDPAAFATAVSKAIAG